MKEYEATEQAYKNGYAKGYEDGKMDAVKNREHCIFYGYNAEALVLVSEMLRKKLITESELDNFFKDFQKMYEIIIREQKTIISEAMVTFEWPSVGDTVQMMWEDRNCDAKMDGDGNG